MKNLNICENAYECPRINCPHRQPHVKIDECNNKCEVKTGIFNSTCIEYTMPINIVTL